MNKFLKYFSFLTIFTSSVLICHSVLIDATDVPIKLFLNDIEVQTDTPPVIVDGRTMVPVRNIAEALGLSVFYDSETNQIYLSTTEYEQSHPHPTPTPTPLPTPTPDIIEVLTGDNFLNLSLDNIKDAISIGINTPNELMGEYIYILPESHENTPYINSLFGDIQLHTPFTDIVWQAHNTPEYSVEDSINYLKDLYSSNNLNFSFSINGNGVNFYRDCTISLLQDSVLIETFNVSDLGEIVELENGSNFSHTFNGIASFNFSKIDFSKPALLKLDYISGISKTYILDFLQYK